MSFVKSAREESLWNYVEINRKRQKLLAVFFTGVSEEVRHAIQMCSSKPSHSSDAVAARDLAGDEKLLMESMPVQEYSVA